MDVLLADYHPICSKEYRQINLGKAGRARWLGRRPRVRGVAMNAVDHPMGGELLVPFDQELS